MNKKKIITVGLALALTVSAAGCTKKSTVATPEKNTAMSEDYSNYYATAYQDNIADLAQYEPFTNSADINKIYENKEYPGNETYLTDVKAAYKNSRDKIQGFVDSMKKQENIADEEVNKMNTDLISEGEKLVANIDTKLKQLDEIPAESYTKSKEEFSKLVGDATAVKDDTKNAFNTMIKDMNEYFGINKK